MNKFFAAFVAVMVAIATPAIAEDGKHYAGFGVGAAFNDFDGIKDQADFNLRAGHDFGVIRTEVDYDHMTADDLKGNLVTGMVYAEPVTFYGVTPYVGVGAGYVWLTDTAASGVSNANDWVFVMAAGASYPFAKGWDLTGDYRYMVSEANTDSLNGLRDFKVHALTVGTRYNF